MAANERDVWDRRVNGGRRLGSINERFIDDSMGVLLKRISILIVWYF